jgi:glutamate-1-semialdehyde aminotransferase
MTNADIQCEKSYFRHLISNGILAMTPSEVHFYISLPHREEEIDKTVEATEEFLKSLTRRT